MRRYETIVIIDPDVPEDSRKNLFDRMKEIISREGGVLVVLQEWGFQRMAYEIKKKSRGYYIRLDYCGMGKLVQEIERFCKIDDRVLKYLTIILKKQVDMESIQQEIAAQASQTVEPPKAVVPESESVQKESDESPEMTVKTSDEITNEATDVTTSDSDDTDQEDNKKEI